MGGRGGGGGGGGGCLGAMHARPFGFVTACIVLLLMLLRAGACIRYIHIEGTSVVRVVIAILLLDAPSTRFVGSLASADQCVGASTLLCVGFNYIRRRRVGS